MKRLFLSTLSLSLALLGSPNAEAKRKPQRKVSRAPAEIIAQEDLITNPDLRSYSDKMGGELNKDWIKPLKPERGLKTYRFVIEGEESKRPRNYQYYNPQMQTQDSTMKADGFKGTLYKASEGKNIFCTQTQQVWPDKSSNNPIKPDQKVVVCLGKEVDPELTEKLYPYSSFRDPNAKAYEISLSGATTSTPKSDEDCPIPPRGVLTTQTTEVVSDVTEILEPPKTAAIDAPVITPPAKPTTSSEVCAAKSELPDLKIQFDDTSKVSAKSCDFIFEPPVIETTDSCLRLNTNFLVPNEQRNSYRFECVKLGAEKFASFRPAVTPATNNGIHSRLFLKDGPGEYECLVGESRKREQGYCQYTRKFIIRNNDPLSKDERKDLLPSPRVPGTSLEVLEQIEKEALFIGSKDKEPEKKLSALMLWFKNHLRPIQTLTGADLQSLPADKTEHHSVTYSWNKIYSAGLDKNGAVRGVGFAYCQQYALLTCTFARTLGIPCKVVTAFKDSGVGHGWAELQIEGKTHYLDGGNEILTSGDRSVYFSALRKRGLSYSEQNISSKQDYQD